MKCIYKVDKSALKRCGVYRIDFGRYNFYIGKTEQSFERRWEKHKCSFKNGTCNQLICDLLEQNPNIEIVFSVVRFLDTEEEILGWESCYINCLLKPNLNIQHPKCRGVNPRCT